MHLQLQDMEYRQQVIREGYFFLKFILSIFLEDHIGNKCVIVCFNVSILVIYIYYIYIYIYIYIYSVVRD